MRRASFWEAAMRRLTLLLIALFCATSLLAQSEDFSCASAFGAGFSEHPEFPGSCCFPGTVPVSGENRCENPNAPPTPAPQPAPTPAPQPAPGSHCIPAGQPCTLGGSPCCAGSCQGSFPNTYCQ